MMSGTGMAPQMSQCRAVTFISVSSKILLVTSFSRQRQLHGAGLAIVDVVQSSLGGFFDLCRILRICYSLPLAVILRAFDRQRIPYALALTVADGSRTPRIVWSHWGRLDLPRGA